MITMTHISDTNSPLTKMTDKKKKNKMGRFLAFLRYLFCMKKKRVVPRQKEPTKNMDAGQHVQILEELQTEERIVGNMQKEGSALHVEDQAELSKKKYPAQQSVDTVDILQEEKFEPQSKDVIEIFLEEDFKPWNEDTVDVLQEEDLLPQTEDQEFLQEDPVPHSEQYIVDNLQEEPPASQIEDEVKMLQEEDPAPQFEDSVEMLQKEELAPQSEDNVNENTEEQSGKEDLQASVQISGLQSRCQPSQEDAPPRVSEAVQMCSFNVPVEYLQILVGEGASTLQALRQQFPVDIQIDCSSGTMTLQGPTSIVDRCYERVNKIVARWQLWDIMRGVIPAPSPAAHAGPTHERKEITECIVHVPFRYRRVAMGEQGCTLNCLRQNHDVQLSFDFPSGTMTIRGPVDRVKRCREDVCCMIDGWRWWDAQKNECQLPDELECQQPSEQECHQPGELECRQPGEQECQQPKEQER